MGKGSRNRQIHLQEKIDHPEKYRKKKQMPKWVTPLIGLVLVAAILVGVVASVVTNNGIIKRNRILLESKSGKFDVNQQMATFLAWQNIYYNAYTYWYYCQYGIYEDTNNITKTFESAEQYALAVAQTGVTTQLRDCIDDIVETLKIYVAVCDEARKNNVALDDEDLQAIEEGINELKTMQTNFGYGSLKAFLKVCMGAGVKEKDIRAALKLTTLYNKYAEQTELAVESAVQLSDLENYRNQNPEDFFKIDYLIFAADNKELADQLKACTTAEEFKKLVLDNHLANNYKAAYNKYTTTQTATEEFATITGKTDANNETALSAALDAINADASQNFNSTDDFTGKTELKDWLFSSKRKQFDTSMLETENGVYLVAFFSAEANTQTVIARVKFLPFSEGDTHGEDTSFKANILEHIAQSKQETPAYPESSYKKASEKAKDFHDELLKDPSTVAEKMEAQNPTKQTGVTSKTTATVKLPKQIIEAVTAEEPVVGKLYTADDGTFCYVILVTDLTEDKKASISYVSFNHDLYYQIINELTTSLDKVYPTEKVGSYKADAAAGTFEAWLSELTDKTALTSARQDGHTNYFETTKDNVTTYNVYMVVNTPMYLETDLLVNGAYLKLSGENLATEVDKTLQALQGKTGRDMVNALSLYNAATTVSDSISKSTADASDTKLGDWFFSADRAANDVETITSTDGKSAFIAIYLDKAETWKVNAKNGYVSEQMNAWMKALAADYTANEKALNRIGQPTPEEETTPAS